MEGNLKKETEEWACGPAMGWTLLGECNSAFIILKKTTGSCGIHAVCSKSASFIHSWNAENIMNQSAFSLWLTSRSLQKMVYKHVIVSAPLRRGHISSELEKKSHHEEAPIQFEVPNTWKMENLCDSQKELQNDG
ncbi:uncharacterized protein PHA67_010607 [Liasis olivaceus]